MRRVIVTGASRGLGLSITRRLVADGFHVVAVARKESEALHALRQESGGAVSFSMFDLSQIEAIPPFVAALKKTYGAPYGLVNNAGLGTHGVLATMPNNDIEALIRMNVTAPIMLSKYVVRNMMSAGEGRVVTISSIVASTGYNGLSVYSAKRR